MKNADFNCRVCGLSQYPDAPWGMNGKEPSHLICECCGTEFGYDDDGFHVCLLRRRNWVEEKLCKWFNPGKKPTNWNMAEQLRAVPQAYVGADDERLIEQYLSRAHESKS